MNRFPFWGVVHSLSLWYFGGLLFLLIAARSRTLHHGIVLAMLASIEFQLMGDTFVTVLRPKKKKEQKVHVYILMIVCVVYT